MQIQIKEIWIVEFRDTFWEYQRIYDYIPCMTDIINLSTGWSIHVWTLCLTT